MHTEKDVSSLSGSSVTAKFEFKYHNKTIYEENGPILFTHRWLSGPSIFNASLYRDNPKDPQGFSCYLTIKQQEITKRLLAYLGFHSNKLPQYFFSTKLTGKRGLDEAKVCWWGILTKELDDHCQSKKIPGLFFLGETINATGETWGFNLQRCRSTAFACSNYFNPQTSHL
jgi:predicted flavoprotein YhiN